MKMFKFAEVNIDIGISAKHLAIMVQMSGGKPNQFGSLIKVVVKVVEEIFWKSHYFLQILLIF